MKTQKHTVEMEEGSKSKKQMFFYQHEHICPPFAFFVFARLP